MCTALGLRAEAEALMRMGRIDDVVSIKPKTFAVLRYLVEHPERLVTKKELLSALWPDVHVDPGTRGSGTTTMTVTYYDVVGTQGVFNMSPTNHNGMDSRARVLVQAVDGQWKLLP